ncbi:MAG TPA: MFS transporter [Streptosporangiaceae bacterium]|nr:MFS transporter [Streptosporangiaceae bacterium]
MAQDMPGAGATDGGTTVVIPGEMAARVDRLPMSGMAWEIALLVQVGWACAGSDEGISARLYPFIWLPHHVITSFEYSVLYALETGIGVLIGAYAIGWLSDKIGRRKALILSSVLAGVFIWPFGYMTSFPALVVLAIANNLGFAGYLAINVVYLSEIMGPAVRGKVIKVSQVLAIFLLATVLAGLIPHYWIPSEYRRYLWLLAGLNIVVALALWWRMPESPRWLEARERPGQARKIVERMEVRVKKRHPVLPEPDLAHHQVVAQEKTSWLAPFGRGYVAVTVFLLVVIVLGNGGIVFGSVGYRYLFLAESRHYSAGFIFALAAWAAAASAAVYLLNALFGERAEPKYTQLAGAILFAGGWWAVYAVHNTRALVTCFIVATVGTTLWQFSMWVYIPGNYPTRMRSLGTGWTDGVGHLGAWGGVLLSGVVFTAAAPQGWILLITIPGALIPASMVAIFGKRQRRRTLEELAR